MSCAAVPGNNRSVRSLALDSIQAIANPWEPGPPEFQALTLFRSVLQADSESAPAVLPVAELLSKVLLLSWVTLPSNNVKDGVGVSPLLGDVLCLLECGGSDALSASNLNAESLELCLEPFETAAEPLHLALQSGPLQTALHRTAYLPPRQSQWLSTVLNEIRRRVGHHLFGRNAPAQLSACSTSEWSHLLPSELQSRLKQALLAFEAGQITEPGHLLYVSDLPESNFGKLVVNLVLLAQSLIAMATASVETLLSFCPHMADGDSVRTASVALLENVLWPWVSEGVLDANEGEYMNKGSTGGELNGQCQERGLLILLPQLLRAAVLEEPLKRSWRSFELPAAASAPAQPPWLGIARLFLRCLHNDISRSTQGCGGEVSRFRLRTLYTPALLSCCARHPYCAAVDHALSLCGAALQRCGLLLLEDFAWGDGGSYSGDGSQGKGQGAAAAYSRYLVDLIFKAAHSLVCLPAIATLLHPLAAHIVSACLAHRVRLSPPQQSDMVVIAALSLTLHRGHTPQKWGHPVASGRPGRRGGSDGECTCNLSVCLGVAGLRENGAVLHGSTNIKEGYNQGMRLGLLLRTARLQCLPRPGANERGCIVGEQELEVLLDVASSLSSQRSDDSALFAKLDAFIHSEATLLRAKVEELQFGLSSLPPRPALFEDSEGERMNKRGGGELLVGSTTNHHGVDDLVGDALLLSAGLGVSDHSRMATGSTSLSAWRSLLHRQGLLFTLPFLATLTEGTPDFPAIVAATVGACGGIPPALGEASPHAAAPCVPADALCGWVGVIRTLCEKGMSSADVLLATSHGQGESSSSSKQAEPEESAFLSRLSMLAASLVTRKASQQAPEVVPAHGDAATAAALQSCLLYLLLRHKDNAALPTTETRDTSLLAMDASADLRVVHGDCELHLLGPLQPDSFLPFALSVLSIPPSPLREMNVCPVLWHELHKLLECWTSLSSAQGEALRALLQLHVEEWLLYGTFGGVLNERTIEWLIVALVVTWSRACYERLSIALAQSPSSAATVSSRDAAKTLFTAEQKQLLHKMLLLLGPPDRQVASCDADPSSRGSVVLFWEIADLLSPLMEETYLIGAPDIGSTSQRQTTPKPPSSLRWLAAQLKLGNSRKTADMSRTELHHQVEDRAVTLMQFMNLDIDALMECCRAGKQPELCDLVARSSDGLLPWLRRRTDAASIPSKVWASGGLESAAGVLLASLRSPDGGARHRAMEVAVANAWRPGLSAAVGDGVAQSLGTLATRPLTPELVTVLEVCVASMRGSSASTGSPLSLPAWMQTLAAGTTRALQQLFSDARCSSPHLSEECSASMLSHLQVISVLCKHTPQTGFSRSLWQAACSFICHFLEHQRHEGSQARTWNRRELLCGSMELVMRAALTDIQAMVHLWREVVPVTLLRGDEFTWKALLEILPVLKARFTGIPNLDDFYTCLNNKEATVRGSSDKALATRKVRRISEMDR